MPRPPLEIDDPTPLDGSRIDLAARIGWLLRTWRVEEGVGLRALAEALAHTDVATSSTALSRAEVAGLRSSRTIDGYERALGLPYGALRAPVDVLCRTYAYRPADLDRMVPAGDLAAFTEACARVEAPRPTGADWLRFAEFHAEGRYGLPAHLARPLIVRLARELGRSLGTGYQLRYEALARLRCSRYGAVVLDAVTTLLLEPGAQRLGDLMSAVCERPTPGLLAWCAELMDHPSDLVARAACLGVQNLRFVGGTGEDEWAAIVPSVVAAIEAATGPRSAAGAGVGVGVGVGGDDPARAILLASTIATSPPALRNELPPGLRDRLPPTPRPQHWTRNRLNVHYSAATELAARVSRGRHGEPMLGRLLFELLFDFRASHAVTSAFLLAGSAFARDVITAVATLGATTADPLTRDGVAGAFTSLMVPTDHLDLPASWEGPESGADVSAGRMLLDLRIAGFAGRCPHPAVLDRCLGEPALRTAVLFAAGMAGDPWLARVADDRDVAPHLRERAGWWSDAGGRLVDP